MTLSFGSQITNDAHHKPKTGVEGFDIFPPNKKWPAWPFTIMIVGGGKLWAGRLLYILGHNITVVATKLKIQLNSNRLKKRSWQSDEKIIPGEASPANTAETAG